MYIILSVLTRNFYILPLIIMLRKLLNVFTEEWRKKNYVTKHATEIVDTLEEIPEITWCKTVEELYASPIFIKWLANIMCLAAKDMIKEYPLWYPTRYHKDINFSPIGTEQFTDKDIWIEKFLPRLLQSKLSWIPIYVDSSDEMRFLQSTITQLWDQNKYNTLAEELINRFFHNKKKPTILNDKNENTNIYEIIKSIRHGGKIIYHPWLTYNSIKKDYQNHNWLYVKEETLSLHQDIAILEADVKDFVHNNTELQGLKKRMMDILARQTAIWNKEKVYINEKDWDYNKEGSVEVQLRKN